MSGHDEGAYEVAAGQPGRGVFLTCEHASSRMPAPWRLDRGDERLIGTHWAYDLGARELTIELALALDAGAVLAGFSRLLVDPNRPEDSDTLFLTRAEGQPIQLNQHVDDAERARRLDGYYRAYHAAVDRELDRAQVELVLAVHSFTPVYEGHERTMEIGVLFDRDHDPAERLARALHDAGLGVAMNQPYSGKQGLIYSVDRHACEHGLHAVELEVRQDRAVDPAFRARLVDLLARLYR